MSISTAQGVRTSVRAVRLALIVSALVAPAAACAGSDASSTTRRVTVTMTVTAPAPASAVGVATSASGPVGSARTTKYVYRVTGNYRATQLHYTASNGDDVTLTGTGRIDTAGSALPWSGEATPEPHGNPNRGSASTRSAKGDSVSTCTSEDDQGNVVASDTGHGAYAGCYASTP